MGLKHFLSAWWFKARVQRRTRKRVLPLKLQMPHYLLLQEVEFLSKVVRPPLLWPFCRSFYLATFIHRLIRLTRFVGLLVPWSGPRTCFCPIRSTVVDFSNHSTAFWRLGSFEFQTQPCMTPSAPVHHVSHSHRNRQDFITLVIRTDRWGLRFQILCLIGNRGCSQNVSCREEKSAMVTWDSWLQFSGDKELQVEIQKCSLLLSSNSVSLKMIHSRTPQLKSCMYAKQFHWLCNSPYKPSTRNISPKIPIIRERRRRRRRKN